MTYKDRKTNIFYASGREQKSDIITNVRKMKWFWSGHNNRLKDDRWTSRVTTSRLYDKKRRQWRPAKRWKDDLDKYWSDAIYGRGLRNMGNGQIRRHFGVFSETML